MGYKKIGEGLSIGRRKDICYNVIYSMLDIATTPEERTQLYHCIWDALNWAYGPVSDSLLDKSGEDRPEITIFKNRTTTITLK